MNPNVANAAVASVELHFNREEGCTAFLVVVPDDVLGQINEGHPLRGLTIAFNGIGPKSSRLFALARALKAAEDAGVVKQDKPAGWVRRLAHRIVSAVYPIARWVRCQRNGGEA